MKNFKKILSLMLALVLCLSVLAGCKNTPDTDSTDATGAGSGTQQTYMVSVKSAGGMAMAGLDVYVYADDKLTDLVTYGQTDEKGLVSWQLPEKEGYAVELKGVPEGYLLADSYQFNGTTAVITLTSQLITDKTLSDITGKTLGVGDVMYDFSIKTPDGTEVKLSEIMKEKKTVLLNFWFSTCGPCANEFPYMEEAYQMYKDNVEIVAMSPSFYDSNESVAAYRQTMGLSFPMAVCPDTWPGVFGVTGYPTSVVIDRYGVICLVEVGGITSLRPFTSAFSHFTAEDYQQKLCESIGDLVAEVKPTYTMDSSENIAAAINQGDISVTYRPETEDENAEMYWPFIITDKNGETCLKASNQGIDSSFAIMYADVELKAGQAVAFDYAVSTESLCDVLYVIVNDEDVYQISGNLNPDEWKSCYPCVAEEDGTYEIALCFIKDESTAEGEDTVYIKDMRIVDASQIDTATYLPRYPYATEDGFEYTYETVVLNESDGYYHVGTADGPLLLADLMGYTTFNEEKSIYFMLYDGDVKVNGESYYDTVLKYFTQASNSSLNGVVTVDAELAGYLQTIASIAGFDENENEWLKICKYFKAFGTEGQQLGDVVQGLSTAHPFYATLGKNVASNFFYYDRPILPRGMLAEFVPSRSGAYRITSRTDDNLDVDGWLFNADHQELMSYEHDERMNEDDINVSMVYYMEAGTPYYISIAFWDMYQTGYIYYDVEYIAPSYQLFRLASPGYFTYDSDATGEQMYHTIAGGIKVVLGDDGYYYEDKGNGEKGGMLYCDFTGVTGVFNRPFVNTTVTNADGTTKELVGLIEAGWFDYSKDENDQQILGYLQANDNDPKKTEDYLKELWGEDFETQAEEYKIEDVFAGIYHGKGEDYTDDIKAYLDKMVTGNDERKGCVPVDEELAQILQALMDKSTFKDVDYSWTKLCYYYDYIGPES